MERKSVKKDVDGTSRKSTFNINDCLVGSNHKDYYKNNSGITKSFLSLESEPTVITEPIATTESIVIAKPPVSLESTKRNSSKKLKTSFDEYRETFLKAPKIIDRQPIFISRELRDKIDEIVRKLGERKMSMSGFAENVLSHHLENYQEDVERWKRL